MFEFWSGVFMVSTLVDELVGLNVNVIIIMYLENAFSEETNGKREDFVPITN